MRRLRLALLLLVAALSRSPPAALAHAFLDHAEPSVGATVSSPPAAVTLTFTEPVEPAFSRLEVFDSEGKEIQAGAIAHPREDTLSVSLPHLAPGAYEVRWKVVSIDTHATEGRFRFSVLAKTLTR